MASLVLGAAGAAVGSLFGAPQLGWMIGAALGNAFFAPHTNVEQVGPRLSDLKVQSSTYGAAIPRLWGTARLTGNLIWSTAILETEHRSSEDSGGKGGPSQTVETTTYSYSVSCAVALCEGLIGGVRRIWANGNLIYSMAAGSDATTVVHSASIADGVRIYPGSETQAADGLIQAHQGVTPAYLGTAYVVFENFQLADYGNRIPNFEFEVVKAASATTIPLVLTSVTGGEDIDPPGEDVPPACQARFSDGVFSALVRHEIGRLDHFGLRWSWALDGTVLAKDPDQFPLGGELDLDPSITLEVQDFVGYLGDHGIWLSGTANSGATGGQLRFVHLSGGRIIAAAGGTASPTEAYVYPVIAADGQSMLLWWWAKDGNLRYEVYDANLNLIKNVPVSSALTNGPFDPYGAQNGAFALEEGGQYLWYAAPTVTYIRLYTLDMVGTSAPSLVGQASTANGWFNATAIASRGTLVVVSRDSFAVVTRLPTLTAGSQTLSNVVTDLCTAAGYSAGDIDVTPLSDTVDGFVLARRGPLRAALEPLAQSYFFDAVEVDGLVKFVKRGGSIAATIQETDLAAHRAGDDMPDILHIRRAQEVDLPSEVSVLYLDRDTAYQQGTQYARRLTGSARDKHTLELPLVLTASKAKQVADFNLWAAWASRVGYEFGTTRRYSHLVPTDVVNVVKSGVATTLRLVHKADDGALIQWRALAEEQSLSSVSSQGVAGPAVSGTLSPAGPTGLYLLDMPILRDQDDDAGIYVAAAGYLSGWRGAQIYKSIDGGSSWSLIDGASILSASVVGTAVTVLPTFGGGNVFDELSTCDVKVYGTLANASEAAVLAGANAAWLGGEIVQFKNAALQSSSGPSNTYRLSGLLRGRRGTEQYMATHAIAQSFVALTSAMQRLVQSTAEIGLLRQFRAVSFGNRLSNASTVNFTNTGVALKPLSPVQIGGGRNAAGDVIINWQRRGRVSGEWRDFSDVPLGEASEAYDVEVWNSTFATLKRTITGLTTPTTTYTAAQQTTDFGGNQATVYVRIYQISSIVGRGFPGQGSV